MRAFSPAAIERQEPRILLAPKGEIAAGRFLPPVLPPIRLAAESRTHQNAARSNRGRLRTTPRKISEERSRVPMNSQSCVESTFPGRNRKIVPQILQRFSSLPSGFRATLLCVAALAISGCTSPPLSSAHKGTDAETSSPASGAWYGDDDKGQAAGQPRYHKVKPGESVDRIAALYGMTVPQLLSTNHGIDPADGLKPGQVIYIPRQK